MGIFAILSLILTAIKALPELIQIIRSIIDLFHSVPKDHQEFLKTKVQEAYAAYQKDGDKLKLADRLKELLGHCKDGICQL